MKYILYTLIALWTLPGLAIIEITPPSRLHDYKINAEVYDTINDQLQKNPYITLTENIRCFDIMETYNTIAQFQAALASMREKNPLWMIAECCVPQCPLTRSLWRNPRNQFEQTISAYINQASANKKQPVNYLAFASGYGFTDFIAIIKALENKVPELNFHVIELQNHCYIATVEQFSKSRTEAFAALPALQTLLTTHIADKELKESLAEDAIAEYLAILKRHELYSQIMQWVSIRYPQTQFRIFLHRDVAEYKKYIAANLTHIADVVGALDFGEHDARAVHFQAPQRFNELLAFIKQHNQSALIYSDIDGNAPQKNKKIEKAARECDCCFATAAMGALGIAALFIINSTIAQWRI